MSQTLAKVTKPDPAKDLEAIEQFKERFKGKRANDLEQARVTCSAKQLAAFKAERVAIGAETDSKKLTKEWTDKKNLREGRRSPKPEPDSERELRENAEAQQGVAKLARETADPLIKAYEAARDELARQEQEANRSAQRSSVKDQIHALVARLDKAAATAKQSGGDEKTKTDLAAKLWRDFQGAIDQDKLTEFEKTLPALEQAVIEAIADVELGPARLALGERITARETGIGALSKARVEDLRAKLATATLLELEKKLMPEVEEAEQRIEEYESLKDDLADRIKTLRDRKVPGQTCDGLKKELDGAIKLAVKSLPDALERLGTVETAVGDLEDEVERMDEAKDDYPDALVAVNKLIGAFDLLTPPALKKHLPANRNKVIQTAAKDFKDGSFIAALDRLQDLEIALKAGLKRADAEKRGLQQEAMENEAREEEERLKEEKRLAEEAAQRAKERKDVPECLDAIGRDRKFATWYNRVKALLDKGIVAVSKGDTVTLTGGDTIEVPLFVTAPRFQRQFVVHYHKGAKPPDPKNPWASKMHAKPHRGNKNTPRVYLNDGDWIFTYAPKFNAV